MSEEDDHRGTENTEGGRKFHLYPESSLTERIIGMAIEVHRQLGPGLLESVYEECLSFELREAGIVYECQVALPVRYKTVRLNCGYRMDVVVERRVIVEIKSVERLLPIHEAQILTYLRLSGMKIALLMNFNSVVLREGLRRFVLCELLPVLWTPSLGGIMEPEVDHGTEEVHTRVQA